MRDTLFISHANPEDNEFTLWLALQLRAEGYQVWCDLTQFFGGETTWREIEKAIRFKIAKFIFVVSCKSNEKEGCFKELQFAESVAKKNNLSNFIVPIRIDNLPFTEFNILLNPRNAIDFYRKWSQGLLQLLQKIEKDCVAKEDVKLSTSVVREWWKTRFNSETDVLNKTDVYSSNWFEIILPNDIYFHKIRWGLIAGGKLPDNYLYPAVRFEQYLVSFAKSKDLTQSGKGIADADESFSLSASSFARGENLPEFVKGYQAKNIIVQLLRLSWEKCVEMHGFMPYDLAMNRKCYYATGSKQDNKIKAITTENGKLRKSLFGYRTVLSFNGEIKKRYWHYGVSVMPITYPCLAYAASSHVVFSDDGMKAWSNPKSMHRARRSQCKNWWNDDWRDRMLLFMNKLRGENDKIEMEVGIGKYSKVNPTPMHFLSPVSYIEPQRKVMTSVEISQINDEETEEIDTISEESEE